jgi:hypothetical protein
MTNKQKRKTCKEAIQLLIETGNDNKPEYWIAMKVLLNERIKLEN